MERGGIIGAEGVRAAGGVVWRPTLAGEREVLVIHRPRYDDWTFPKGKVEEGESDEEAALREVREETCLECSLGVELASVSYADPRGRPKTVRYWLMRPMSGSARPGDTVDEIRWVAPAEAASLLSHARDREVLRGLPEAR